LKAVAAPLREAGGTIANYVFAEAIAPGDPGVPRGGSHLSQREALRPYSSA
jgi:hypothetical protein